MPVLCCAGLPSIVTDANIRLLFDIHDEIEHLAAELAPDPGRHSALAAASAPAGGFGAPGGGGRSGAGAGEWSGRRSSNSSEGGGSGSSSSRPGGGARNGGGGGGLEASTAVWLEDVCLKPLGDACAVQSVGQYWKLSREVYEKGGRGFYVRILC